MKNLALIVGVELTERPSLASEIRAEFDRSQDWLVSQAWYRLGSDLTPKFVLINHILSFIHNLHDYKYVIVCDDDISLPTGFLDTYLGIVDALSFGLAQPARTPASVIHHSIVKQVDGLTARETRFVEIGPLFSMHREVVSMLTPFDTSISPMGWGYEFVWARKLDAAGEKMGIVDCAPVDHTMRPPVSGYSGAGDQMVEYLRANPHMPPQEAYATLAEYPL